MSFSLSIDACICQDDQQNVCSCFRQNGKEQNKTTYIMIHDSNLWLFRIYIIIAKINTDFADFALFTVVFILLQDPSLTGEEFGILVFCSHTMNDTIGLNIRVDSEIGYEANHPILCSNEFNSTSFAPQCNSASDASNRNIYYNISAQIISFGNRTLHTSCTIGEKVKVISPSCSGYCHLECFWYMFVIMKIFLLQITLRE